MKQFIFPLFATLMIVLGCGDTLDKTGGVAPVTLPPSDSTIDAVSSASEKFKLNGGEIFRDSLVIDFWYKYDNGFTWALIIDEFGDTISCDTLNEAPFLYVQRQDHKHAIKPLNSNTSYKLIMDGDWDGDRWPLDTVEFTTRHEESIKDTSIQDTSVQDSIVDSVTTIDPLVDGITSASGKFTLNSGEVSSDSLLINFTYEYDNGFTWALVIDENNDTVICDTLNILPYAYLPEMNQTHSLKPLVPNTNYRLIMNGYWDDDGWEIPALDWPLDTVHFTTDAITSASRY